MCLQAPRLVMEHPFEADLFLHPQSPRYDLGDFVPLGKELVAGRIARCVYYFHVGNQRIQFDHLGMRMQHIKRQLSRDI